MDHCLATNLIVNVNMAFQSHVFCSVSRSFLATTEHLCQPHCCKTAYKEKLRSQWVPKANANPFAEHSTFIQVMPLMEPQREGLKNSRGECQQGWVGRTIQFASLSCSAERRIQTVLLEGHIQTWASQRLPCVWNGCKVPIPARDLRRQQLGRHVMGEH